MVSDKSGQAWPAETRRIVAKFNQLYPRGIFATGIENSDPWVEGSRRDQLQEAYDFYQNFPARLKAIKALGIDWVRFGVGYSLAHPEEDRFNFELTDSVVAECQKLKINIIFDLLHFGLPEWLHKENPKRPFFQNANFPTYFAEYARAVARRYPSLKYFTPVNEPFVTCRFSAKDGLWNEQILSQNGSDRPFVRAITNTVRAAILAKSAIEQVWTEERRPDEPIFFQNESFEAAMASLESHRQQEAQRFNMQRFATTDLLFGYQDERVKDYLISNGLSQSDYDWFMKMGNRKRTVLGIDYYPWSIHRYAKEGMDAYDPRLSWGLNVLVAEYFRRYRMPMLHMEVNAPPELAVEMCQSTYEGVARMRQVGYPILGMTWFGDDLQIGWQSALLGSTGHDEYRVGLFYHGHQEPVGQLFGDLAKQGLPTISPA